MSYCEHRRRRIHDPETCDAVGSAEQLADVLALREVRPLALCACPGLEPCEVEGCSGVREPEPVEETVEASTGKDPRA